MGKRAQASQSLVKGIEDSRQAVTVLFTDIEDSTRLWESRGDIRGRLMVDRHNRLLFPAVRQFRGRVIKTIGDSIMAAFKDPGDALQAAVAMQQLLAQERERDRNFKVRVRIGIHTGKALVESGDVYGDMVNVAARVESEADGDQILVSGSTASKIHKQAYQLKPAGSFLPKGKRSRVNLFRCDWRKAEDLSHRVTPSRFSLIQKQKLEILVYIAATLIWIGALYQVYLRFLIADREGAALPLLNPALLPRENPLLFFGLMGGLGATVVLVGYIRDLPLWCWRVLKGVTLAGVVWSLTYGVVRFVPLKQEFYWDEALYQSDHLFVQVVADRGVVREQADLEAPVLLEVEAGDLLLLNRVHQNGSVHWNRVLIAPRKFGWIERVTPARIGVAEQRITFTEKFYFRFKDIYPLLLAIPAFFYGLLRFRVRAL